MRGVKIISGPIAALTLLVSMVAQATSISGTPPTTATVGKSYAFTPTLSNPSTCSSCFRILSMPSWASFSTQTGKLSGTPTAAGVWANIRISARATSNRASLAPFTITVTTAVPAVTLRISGSPATSTTVGKFYSFNPTVIAAAGSTRSFTVTNKPAWAAFNPSTGHLSGTPTAVATYSNIGIAVSDGKTTAKLAPFTLAVTAPAPAPALGTVTLDWTIPTLNTDGSALTDLAGFRVYYGSSASALTKQVSIGSPATTQASIEQLTVGTWYFAISDYTGAGVESAKSSVVSLVVR